MYKAIFQTLCCTVLTFFTRWRWTCTSWGYGSSCPRRSFWILLKKKYLIVYHVFLELFPNILICETNNKRYIRGVRPAAHRAAYFEWQNYLMIEILRLNKVKLCIRKKMVANIYQTKGLDTFGLNLIYNLLETDSVYLI